MGTKNNPGKYDCYNKAEPDEPVFTLMGRDRNSATLIWLWTALREIQSLNLPPEEKVKEDDKIHEARQCVVDIIDYRMTRGLESEGIASSVLAGVFELMRTANMAVNMDTVKNNPTSVDAIRAYLCMSRLPNKDDNSVHTTTFPDDEV